MSNRTAVAPAAQPAGAPDLYYEAGWTHSWCHGRCSHRHPTIAEAAQCGFACGPTGYVFAVENGEGRALNADEEQSWNKLRRSQVLSSPKATVTAEFSPPKATVGTILLRFKECHSPQDALRVVHEELESIRWFGPADGGSPDVYKEKASELWASELWALWQQFLTNTGKAHDNSKR